MVLLICPMSIGFLLHFFDFCADHKYIYIGITKYIVDDISNQEPGTGISKTFQKISKNFSHILKAAISEMYQELQSS